MSEYNAHALKPAELVRALKAAGSRTVTEATVAADVSAGAPVNADGTIDIFLYAAWVLSKENSRHAS